VSPVDDPDAPAAPRALVAARARIKALLDTVRRLEEERGAALLRVADLEGRVVGDVVIDDAVLARALVNAMPRTRVVSCRVLAVMLCLSKGSRSVSELRDALGIAQATASEWLQEAVDVGVVALVEDASDRRRHVAELTAKGHVYARNRRSRPATHP